MVSRINDTLKYHCDKFLQTCLAECQGWYKAIGSRSSHDIAEDPELAELNAAESAWCASSEHDYLQVSKFSCIHIVLNIHKLGLKRNRGFWGLLKMQLCKNLSRFLLIHKISPTISI